jgi:uncharacterized protein (TIGR00255 family)
MTLSSMTGFARTNGQHGGANWAWELRSVNAKGFDLRLRLPPATDVLEADVRRMAGTVIIRGTVQASLTLERPARAPVVRVNEVLLNELASRLGTVARNSGLAAPTLDTLLNVRGVVEVVDDTPADPEAEAALMQALSQGFEDALVQLCAARQSEGEALKSVLLTRVARMRELTKLADAAPCRQAEAIQAKLQRMLTDLAGALPALDPQRLHQEALLLAMRADIREELDRLQAHTDQGEDLLTRGGAVGRRLDFLCQELGREANTLCAKANDPSLTSIGLDLKTVVEQFREQVQNVE